MERNELTAEERKTILKEFESIKEEEINNMSFAIFTQCYSTQDLNGHNVWNSWNSIGYDELKDYLSNSVDKPKTIYGISWVESDTDTVLCYYYNYNGLTNDDKNALINNWLKLSEEDKNQVTISYSTNIEKPFIQITRTLLEELLKQFCTCEIEQQK